MLPQEHSVGIVAGLVLVASTVTMSHSLGPLSRMLHVPFARPSAPALDDVTASIDFYAQCDARQAAPAQSRRPVSQRAACEARRLRREAEACYALARPVTCAAGTPPAPRS